MIHGAEYIVCKCFSNTVEWEETLHKKRRQRTMVAEVARRGTRCQMQRHS